MSIIMPNWQVFTKLICSECRRLRELVLQHQLRSSSRRRSSIQPLVDRDVAQCPYMRTHPSALSHLRFVRYPLIGIRPVKALSTVNHKSPMTTAPANLRRVTPTTSTSLSAVIPLPVPISTSQ